MTAKNPEDTLAVSIRYLCPCDTGEVLNVTSAVRLSDGEAVFLARMKHLYRQALTEIARHEEQKEAA